MSNKQLRRYYDDLEDEVKEDDDNIEKVYKKISKNEEEIYEELKKQEKIYEKNKALMKMKKHKIYHDKKLKKKKKNIKKKKKKRKKDDDEFLERIVNEVERNEVVVNVDKEMLNEKRVKKAKKKHRERNRVYLVNSKFYWNDWRNPGVFMEFVELKNGIKCYTFKFDENYLKSEQEFFNVGSSNPDLLMDFYSNNHHWHINSLLSLNELFVRSNNDKNANDVIERILYIYERSWKESFLDELVQGKAELLLNYSQKVNNSLDIKPNIPFFLSLWKRIFMLSNKRHAYENCKLLYYLDPENDPCHVLLLIDYFAIQSNSFKDFLDFIDRNNIDNLPNIMYSSSLIMFLMSQNDGKMLEDSNNLLQKALLQFPSLLTLLLDRLDNIENVNDWNNLLHNSVFTNKICTDKTIQTLIECYVSKCWSLWNSSNIIHWIYSNVINFINKDIPTSEQHIEYYHNTNIYNNVTLSEISGNGSTPPLLLHTKTSHKESSSSYPNIIFHFLKTLIPLWR